MKKRRTLLAGAGAVVALVVVAIIIFLIFAGESEAPGKPINSFDECVAAGNPVAESYPEQCHAGGKSFTNPRQTAPPPPEP